MEITSQLLPTSPRPHVWDPQTSGLNRLYESLFAQPERYERSGEEQLFGVLQELVDMSELKGLQRATREGGTPMLYFRPPTLLPLSQSQSHTGLIPGHTQFEGFNPYHGGTAESRQSKFREQRQQMTPNNESI